MTAPAAIQLKTGAATRPAAPDANAAVAMPALVDTFNDEASAMGRAVFDVNELAIGSGEERGNCNTALVSAAA